MNPTDVRNMQWNDLQARMTGPRQFCYEKLLERGPSTTRELAECCGLSLLTVRPRVTELVQLGLVQCHGCRHGEGVYAALPAEEARRRFEQARAAAPRAEQTLLKVDA